MTMEQTWTPIRRVDPADISLPPTQPVDITAIMREQYLADLHGDQ